MSHQYNFFKVLTQCRKELGHIYAQHADSMTSIPSSSVSRRTPISHQLQHYNNMRQLGNNYHVLGHIISFFDLSSQLGVWCLVSRSLCDFIKETFPAINSWFQLNELIHMKYKEHKDEGHARVTIPFSVECVLHAFDWQHQVMCTLKKMEKEEKTTSLFPKHEMIVKLNQSFINSELRFVQVTESFANSVGRFDCIIEMMTKNKKIISLHCGTEIALHARNDGIISYFTVCVSTRDPELQKKINENMNENMNEIVSEDEDEVAGAPIIVSCIEGEYGPSADVEWKAVDLIMEESEMDTSPWNSKEFCQMLLFLSSPFVDEMIVDFDSSNGFPSSFIFPFQQWACSQIRPLLSENLNIDQQWNKGEMLHREQVHALEMLMARCNFISCRLLKNAYTRYWNTFFPFKIVRDSMEVYKRIQENIKMLNGSTWIVGTDEYDQEMMLESWMELSPPIGSDANPILMQVSANIALCVYAGDQRDLEITFHDVGDNNKEISMLTLNSSNNIILDHDVVHKVKHLLIHDNQTTSNDDMADNITDNQFISLLIVRAFSVPNLQTGTLEEAEVLDTFPVEELLQLFDSKHNPKKKPSIARVQ